MSLPVHKRSDTRLVLCGHAEEPGTGCADAGGSGTSDCDGDGLYDWDEVNVYFTNPSAWDTDGDGVGDGDEVYVGADPLSAEMSSALPLDAAGGDYNPAFVS
jgi:hypothetical protein